MKISATVIVTLSAAVAISACSSKGYADDGYYSSKSDSTAKIVTKTDTQYGEVFATNAGLTLYTFTKDTAGTSNCYGGCAVNWPPFAASKEAKEWGAFTKVERNDGSLQWAYNNQPLYRWIGDQNKGDAFGQGVGNVWYVLNTPK